jgi:hypothetical protein
VPVDRSALCLRVRLMRFIRLYVARVSPEAYRPDACRSMVWLRFWSPSTTRVRSQLFVFVERDTVKVYDYPPLLELAGLTRADRWGLFVKEVRSFIKGKEMQRSAVTRVDLGIIYLP